MRDYIQQANLKAIKYNVEEEGWHPNTESGGGLNVNPEPIYVAIEEGYVECVAYMLEKLRERLDGKLLSGEKPQLYLRAAQRNAQDEIAHLIWDNMEKEAGAELPEVKSNYFYTRQAAKAGDVSTLQAHYTHLISEADKAIAESEGQLDESHRAREVDQFLNGRRMIGWCDSPDHIHHDGVALLHVAAAAGQVEVVRWLLSQEGINSNVETAPEKLTPLHMAVMSRNNGVFGDERRDVIKLLLEPVQGLKLKNPKQMTLQCRQYMRLEQMISVLSIAF